MASSPASSPAPANQDIYVMPEKFQSHKAKSSSGKALIIVLIIFILVAGASAAYFLYDMWQRNQAAQELALLQNQNENQNMPPFNEIINNENFNANANANLNGNENGNSNENINNGNENANGNSNGNQNINAGQPAAPPTVSSDADRDGLTDLEENIFITSPTKPDTDSDGYLDGSEVLNGYDPTKVNSAKIKDASAVQVVTTSFAGDNFEFLNIKNWPVSPISASRQVVITTDTGEIIRISVKDNPDKLSAANWYLNLHPQTSLSDLKTVKADVLEGIFSPSGLEAYLVNPEKTKIYTFEYLLSDVNEFRYPAIFNMMIKTFKAVNTLLAANCLGVFCQDKPCGPLPDGGNSCETATGVCYEKSCQANADCSVGKTCQQVDCLAGDAIAQAKVCK